MNTLDILNAIEAIQKAEEVLVEVFGEAKIREVDEEYLGALALLSQECQEFYENYEKEAAALPTPEGVAW